MATKNKYGRGNVRLLPRDKVYIPHFSDKSSYLGLSDYGIISGLIHGRRAQREHILHSIKGQERVYFPIGTFLYFVFCKIYEWLKDDITILITPEMILDQIFDYFPKIWGYEPKWREVRNEVYILTQIYYMSPQKKDIDLIVKYRKPYWIKKKNIRKLKTPGDCKEKKD